MELFTTITIDDNRLQGLLDIEEGQFVDIKAKAISPAKLSQTVSSFANASGGDIYIGIMENTRTHQREWDGFSFPEEANAITQMLVSLSPLVNFYTITYLKHPKITSYLLQVTIEKTSNILHATDGSIYIRNNASKLLIDTPEKLRRLELDKGIVQFENEIVREAKIEDAAESEIMSFFSKSIVPNISKADWLSKQRLSNDGSLTVAAIMLFTDEPQIFLPKRSAIKIYRYKTSGEADRDMLDGMPITIEGSAYTQIYEAVKKVKEIIQSIRKLGAKFESIDYPYEAIHEVVTNAVLHRDYSISTDIQIRIFDNRVEIESPGRLPGYVTVKNILEEQVARNPKIVRLINKFPYAPNKDVGEGLNTAFAAMTKLRLKVPEIYENPSSVLVIIKHEKLASPDEMIVEYLTSHDSIKNALGREITGIKSENIMKQVFYRLRDSGFITLVKGPNYWIKADDFDMKVKEQFGNKL